MAQKLKPQEWQDASLHGRAVCFCFSMHPKDTFVSKTSSVWLCVGKYDMNMFIGYSREAS